eukprot:1787473-Pyramimonas_sp.AAC.1
MSKPSARTPRLLNDAVNRPGPEKTSRQPWRPTSPHRAPPCRGTGDLRRALITSCRPWRLQGGLAPHQHVVENGRALLHMVENVRHEHREHVLSLSDLGIPTNGALGLPPAAGHNRGPVPVLPDEVVGGTSVPALVQRQAAAKSEVESSFVHQ